MGIKKEPPQVTALCLEETVRFAGSEIPVRIEYPRLSGSGYAVRRINRFYAHAAAALLRFVRRTAGSKRRSPLDAVRAGFTVACCGARHLSLCRQITCRTHTDAPETLQLSETWDLQTGFLCQPYQFLPHRNLRALRKTAVDLAAAQADKSRSVQPASGYAARIRRSTDPKNYYVTDTEVFLFFPPGTLAPADEGVVTLRLARRADVSAPGKEAR